MLKHLYPILVIAGSKAEEVLIKYFDTNKICYSKGDVHILKGIDNEEYAWRHLSFEMTDNEYIEFINNMIFDL